MDERVGKGLSPQDSGAKSKQFEDSPLGKPKDAYSEIADIFPALQKYKDEHKTANLQKLMVEILEFSRPNNKIFAPIFRFYFHKVMPIVGGWISGDRAAYDYLPASVDKFPSPERFVEMMREAGLQECRAKRLTFGVAYIYIGVKR